MANFLGLGLLKHGVLFAQIRAMLSSEVEPGYDPGIPKDAFVWLTGCPVMVTEVQGDLQDFLGINIDRKPDRSII
jgi:hypothetical protein